MTDLLKKIIIPQLEFEGIEASEKFINLFADLYRVELFKDGLDLILTKLQENHLRFEVKITKGWDTNVGCFLTEKKTFYDQTLGKFLRKSGQKIILRKLAYNVMAHEMAHAWEFESGIDLGEDFRKAIGLDMKGRKPEIVTLNAEVKRLMVEALRAYPSHQFLSELFARYFELLSISRDVCAVGGFATADVMNFFANTTNFLRKIFNPKIRPKIDQKIAYKTIEIAKKIKLAEPKQKFQEKVESFHQKANQSNKISWSNNVQSNASWFNSWQKDPSIESKKS